jgi:hypothetical protein
MHFRDRPKSREETPKKGCKREQSSTSRKDNLALQRKHFKRKSIEFQSQTFRNYQTPAHLTFLSFNFIEIPRVCDFRISDELCCIAQKTIRQAKRAAEQ